MLVTLSWKLHGKSYRERRIADRPDQLKRHFESLACRDWPITDVSVCK